MRSDDLKSYEFFREFQQYYKELGAKSLLFEPHYKYTTCAECTSFDKDVEGCILKGKYCGALNNELKITNATQVVTENVRQKCIWYLNKEKNPLFYWNYMINYADLCMSPLEPNFSDTCSKKVIHK